MEEVSKPYFLVFSREWDNFFLKEKCNNSFVFIRLSGIEYAFRDGICWHFLANYCWYFPFLGHWDYFFGWILDFGSILETNVLDY